MAYTRAQLNGEDLKDLLDALNAVVYVDENGKLITDADTEDMESICCWETATRHDERWQAVSIEWFMARGMRRVYRRVEGFGHLHLTLDVWYTRDGRLLARLWSRSEETDLYAYEVKGFVPPECDGELGENWVPKCLREKFGQLGSQRDAIRLLRLALQHLWLSPDRARAAGATEAEGSVFQVSPGWEEKTRRCESTSTLSGWL